jgi:hypothetical protein
MLDQLPSTFLGILGERMCCNPPEATTGSFGGLVIECGCRVVFPVLLANCLAEVSMILLRLCEVVRYCTTLKTNQEWPACGVMIQLHLVSH